MKRVILIVTLSMLSPMAAAGQSTNWPNLTGIYVIVPDSETIPGGLRNQGSPEEISLLPAAAEIARKADLSLDTAKDCQGIGPFRMMARGGNMIEIMPSPRTGRIFIMFEDTFLGLFRQIIMDRDHDPKRPPAFNGDSIGRWDKDTLAVDTRNFNDYIWLNSKGAPKSNELHLNERIRLVAGENYLEVRMTANDPKVLSKPYTYARYYKRVNAEIPQYVCTDDLLDHQIPEVD